MDQAKLPPQEDISRIHRLAQRQLELIKQGSWQSLFELIETRRQIIADMEKLHRSTPVPLKQLCRQIITFDERTIEELEEIKQELLRRANRLRQAKQTVGAYDLKTDELPTAPRYIDEKK